MYPYMTYHLHYIYLNAIASFFFRVESVEFSTRELLNEKYIYQNSLKSYVAKFSSHNIT